MGRHADLDALDAVVAGNRFVSVLGPPGVGKSRLTHRWAERALDEGRFAGGVWWCELGPLTGIGAEPEAAIIAAVRATTGIDEAWLIAARDPPGPSRLPAPTVVVLDEAETHAGALRALLPTWLARLPDVRWVMTSRARLDLQGEICFDVGPLDTHENGDAVALLEARALAVDRHLDATREAPRLRAIATLLDGLPLAIELAAARLRVMSTAELASALADDPHRALGPRVADAIASSWNDLDSNQRELLAQACVFRGGFDRAAAEAVLAVAPEGPAVIEIIAALVDRCLVAPHHCEATSERRFDMLTCVRHFAETRAAPEALAQARKRHEDHLLGRAECWMEAGQRDHLLQERANLAAVHRNALERGAAEPAVRAATALSELAPSMGFDWCERLLSEALNADDAIDSTARARGLERRAMLRRFQGRLDESRRDLETCLDVAQRIGDEVLGAAAWTGLGNAYAHEAAWRLARPLLERALAHHLKCGDRRAEGRTRAMVAATWFNEDDLDKASTEAARALSALREAGDTEFEPIVLASLGFIEQARGRLAPARTHLEEARATLERRDDQHWAAVADGYLALVDAEQGHTQRACARLNYAIERLEQLGVRRALGVASEQRGVVYLRMGRAADARDDLYAALRLHRAHSPDRVGIVQGWLAAAAALDGEHLLATACLTEAASALEAHQRPGHRAALAGLERLTILLCRRDRSGEQRDDEVPNWSPWPSTGEVRVVEALVADAEVQLKEAEARVRRTYAPDALVVETTGAWFRPAGTTERVELSRRRALRRILVALAEARLDHVGEPITQDCLIEVGWPKERVLERAGLARIHNAVATLRKLGLRECLLRRDPGYLLDPDLPLEFARDGAFSA